MELLEVKGWLCSACGTVFSHDQWQEHHKDRGGHEGKTVRCTQCNSELLTESTGYKKADGSPHIAGPVTTEPAQES